MSGWLAGKVWQSALAADLKPLAAALADIANDDGTSIYPSVAYVAWLLGKASRSVQRGLSRLRKAEILRVVRGGKGGKYLPTEYRLIESKLPIREPWRNHDILSPFAPNHDTGVAPCVPNHDTGVAKPRHLRHERVTPVSYKPLRTVINKTRTAINRVKPETSCSECCGSGYVYVEKGGNRVKVCPKCSPGVAGNAKEA